MRATNATPCGIILETSSGRTYCPRSSFSSQSVTCCMAAGPAIVGLHPPVAATYPTNPQRSRRHTCEQPHASTASFRTTRHLGRACPGAASRPARGHPCARRGGSTQSARTRRRPPQPQHPANAADGSQRALLRLSRCHSSLYCFAGLAHAFSRHDFRWLRPILGVAAQLSRPESSAGPASAQWA